MSSAVLPSSGTSSSGSRRLTMPGPRTPRSTLGSYGRPPTGDNLADMRPTSKEGLTPMPDYMHPVTKSAAKRWRKLHEDHLMAKLVEKRVAKKAHNLATHDEARRLAKKIPMEVLAKEWLQESEVTVETKAYLLDKILPTLILGLEKLLLEVDKKGLAEQEVPGGNFNPINYLAQYLLRNNPKYSNFSEASPYIRGLRQISEQLKQDLFDLGDNRLAKVKAEARRKREDRERAEVMQMMEKKRRGEALQQQFEEWNVGRYVDGRVELALIQNALRSYVEIAEQFPEDEKEAARLTHELDPTDDSGRTLSLREYVQYLALFIEDMPSEMFDQFMHHMGRCAKAYRLSAERDVRKGALSQLFMSCDHTGVGFLDRHRILNLFEMFYDKAASAVRQEFRNPRQWPVVEVNEVDSSLEDSDEEGEGAGPKHDPRFIDNNVDVTEETTGKSGVSPTHAEAELQPEVETDENQGTVEESKDGAIDEVETDENQGTVEESKDGAIDEKVSEQESSTEEEKETIPTEQKTEHDEEVKGSPEDAEPVMNEDEKAEDEGFEENSEKDELRMETILEVKEEGEESPSSKQQPALTKEAATTSKSDTAVSTETTGVGVGDATVTTMDEGAEVVAKEDAQPEDKDADAADAVKNASEDDEDAELAGLSGKGDISRPPKTGDRPPMTQQSKVSFAEGTAFDREQTLLTSHGTRSQSQASAFDEDTLNLSQFVHTTETFLGDGPEMDVFGNLMSYIKEGYVETEDEKMDRLMKAKHAAMEVKKKALLNSLFEMWDNDGSGFLDLDEVETVMKKYKDAQELEAIQAAKLSIKKRSKNHDSRLSKREFREFIYTIVTHMSGTDSFDYFVEFLLNSVERTYQERVRGEARKKWLQQIITVAETSGANMEPVYKSVFQALYKDAESHGGGKHINAYVSLLERNALAPKRGDTLIRYTAATTDDAEYLLNKVLFKDMKGVSFAAVESGKPIHVPRVMNHGNIHFWNPSREEEEKDGSFIVVPLKDQRKHVFGLLGIDTLDDQHSRSIFITHEIQFFQGVAKAFSIAYHHVDVRQKTMRISESAVSWIHRRCPTVHEVTVYMVEPENKGQDYVLRKMMTTDLKGNAVMLPHPPRLERKDNLFRDYLFKCVDNSESVTADAYGERHLSFPLRDDEGRAIVVVDISIGTELKSLPKAENKEVMKMLRLLQVAYKEISRENRDGERTMMIEGDNLDNDSRIEILFDRLMLMELRENVAKLDAKAYAELKSYKEPPKVVHFILKSVLAVFHTDKASAGEFDDWNKCKAFVNPSLSHKILAYDPTEGSDNSIPVELINSYLAEVPHGSVSKHGSIPAQYLYNWVFVCVSLIEHSNKNKPNKGETAEEEEQEDATDAGQKQGGETTEQPPEGDAAAPRAQQEAQAIQGDQTTVDAEVSQQHEQEHVLSAEQAKETQG